MTRRTTATLLALVLVLSLGGCTGHEPEASPSSGPSSGPSSVPADGAASSAEALAEPGPDHTWVSRGGWMVAVPANWTFTPLRCGVVPAIRTIEGAYYVRLNFDRCLTRQRRQPPPSIGLVSPTGVETAALTCAPRCSQTLVTDQVALIISGLADAADVELVIDSLRPITDGYVAVPVVTGSRLATAVERVHSAGLMPVYDGKFDDVTGSSTRVTADGTTPRTGSVVLPGTEVELAIRVAIID